MTETGCFDFWTHLRGNMILEENDIHQLNGDAYELIVVTAGAQMGWNEWMYGPVRPKESKSTDLLGMELCCTRGEQWYDKVQHWAVDCRAIHVCLLRKSNVKTLIYIIFLMPLKQLE